MDWVLSRVDPSTGAAKKFAQFEPEFTPRGPSLNHTSMVCSEKILGESLLAPRVRAFFNTDYSKMAASRVMKNDNSAHVGWVDEAGTFTDISEKITDTSGFGKVPDHRNPRFAPDGSFVFIDVNAEAYIYVDPTTMEITNTVTGLYDPVLGAVTDNLREDYMFNQQGRIVRDLDDGGISHDQILPYGDARWFSSDHTLLVLSDGRGLSAPSEYQTSTLEIATAAERDLPEPVAISPESDYWITSAVPATPDSTTEVLFIGVRGETADVFRIEVSGAMTTPTKVGTLTGADPKVYAGGVSTALLLGW